MKHLVLVQWISAPQSNKKKVMNVGTGTKASTMVIEHILKAINKSMKDASK